MDSRQYRAKLQSASYCMEARHIIKFIKGYEGRYGVDENGNIYSYCIVGSHNGNVTSTPNRILVPHTGKDSNYLQVGLSKLGKVSNALVHRLVAEAFVPNPLNLEEVDHIDNNPRNNKAENLQWVTRQLNMDKVFEHSSPTRNYKITCLKLNSVIKGYFISKQAACVYASKYGASSTSLNKYNHSRGWTVESVSTISQESSIWDENGCEVVPEFGIKF